MTSPFLEYELLTPETADPVVIRITGQREKRFNAFIASNGVNVISAYGPEFFPAPLSPTDGPVLYVQGDEWDRDDERIPIPLSDWPAVKQAIRELNAYYECKEKDMKEDRYEFDLDEWDYRSGGPDEADIILTRKKPKVDDRENTPVKVEYLHIWSTGSEYRLVDDYGAYHLVQFRVTGFAWNEYLEWIRCDGHLAEVSILLTRQRTVSSFNPSHCENQRHFLYIGLDARDKWSAPVLLPESVYSRLDEICWALENKAHGGKG